MVLNNGKRRQANHDFDRGVGVTRLRMRQALFSVGDDFWIDDDAGNHLYRVDGKLLHLRRTFHLEDLRGGRLATIRRRPLRLKDSMSVDGADGRRLALVKKAFFDPVRDRWHITQTGSGDLTTHGDVFDHEYTIERDGRKVAEVSKKWFRIRDTYGLALGPDIDVQTALGVAVAIDAMAHPAR